MKSKSHLLTAALEYAARGWCVIPLQRDKKPALKQWKPYQQRRPTEAELRAWFSEGKGTIGNVVGVGIVCGFVSGGLVVRDFDTMEGYTVWARAFPDLAGTLPTVETGRGRHVYLQGDTDTIIKLEDGELRGAGYVCAPPTIHPSGKVYSWLVPLPAGALPRLNPGTAGLLGRRAGGRRTGAAVARARREPESSFGGDWLARALAKAGEGNRHNAGMWLACQLRDDGVPQDKAEGIMKRFAAGVPRGDHPYTEGEALATLAGVYETPARAKATRPRARPELLPAWILALHPKPHPRVLLERIAEQCSAEPIDDRGSLGYCIAGFKKLAKQAHVCDRTVKRRVKTLVAEGMLVVVRRGGFDPDTGEACANVYAIPGEFEALDNIRDTGRGTPKRFHADRVTKRPSTTTPSVECLSVTLYPRKTKPKVATRVEPRPAHGNIPLCDAQTPRWTSEPAGATMAPQSPTGDVGREHV